MTQFEKTYQFMKKPWVILIYACLTVLVYQTADKSVAIYFHQLNLRSSLSFLNILTALGQWIAYTILFTGLVIHFRYIKKNAEYEKKAWYLLGCILVPNLIVLVLKIVLGRARPDLLFANNEFGFYWLKFSKLYWSFPSGHTVTITALMTGFGILMPAFFSSFIVIALLVSASRVLLYHHYVSDVMAGFYFSLLAVVFYTHYFKQKFGGRI